MRSAPDRLADVNVVPARLALRKEEPAALQDVRFAVARFWLLRSQPVRSALERLRPARPLAA